MKTAAVPAQTPTFGKAATYAMLTATAIFWGSAFVTSKIVVGDVPPSAAAFIRFGLGAFFAVLLLIILRSRDKTVQVTPNGNWAGVLVLGLVGVAAYNLLLFWGLAYSKASDGSMIIPTLSPAITVVLAVIFLKEKFRWQQVTGLGITLAGSAVFFLSVVLGEVRDIHRITGDFMFIAAAACWSIYTLMGKKILQRISPLVATAYAMLFGSVVIGAFSVRDLAAVHWTHLSLDFWVSQFYMALFPSVLANWFYYLGVKRIGPARAAVFLYIVPVAGLVLATVMIGDVLTVAQIAGSALMLLGVSIVNRRSGRRKKDIDIAK